MRLLPACLPILRPALMLAIGLLAAAPAYSQVFTWSGGAGNQLWTDPDNWDGAPAATYEPNGIPDAPNHAVVIGGGTDHILIRAQDTVSCGSLDQTGRFLDMNGRLKVYGSYNLNFPAVSAATGTLTMSGNTVAGTGTLFGTQVPIGSVIYLADKTMVGIVGTAPSATSATVLLQYGLSVWPIATPSAFLYRAPVFAPVGGATVSTNVAGELANVVTGGPFTAAMRGRVIRSGGQIIGVVMSFESSTRIRLANIPSQTLANAAFDLSDPITESGSGVISCGAGSRVSFLGNGNQNIPARTYANLYIEDSRVSGYADLYKGPYITAADVYVTEQLRQRQQVRLSTLMGTRMLLSAGAMHMTWIGDNNNTSAASWPLATLGGSEENPYALVYGTGVNRYILHMGSGTVYNEADFTNKASYGDLTIVCGGPFTSVTIPSKAIMVINGDLTIGTVATTYPSGNPGGTGNHFVLGSSSSSSSQAVDFTLVGNYLKLGAGGTLSRGSSNRTRVKVRGSGALAQAFFDEMAAANATVTELNINRPGMANTYTGNADTYDLTSGQITLTGATRSSDFIALRPGGVTPPVLNLGATDHVVNFGYAQQAGTVASTLPGNTLTTTGIWLQNDGVFSPGTGTVAFTGPGGQSITVGAPASCIFNRLVVNKAAGNVTVSSGAVRVLDELSLPSGNAGNLVTTASGSLTLGSTAAKTARVSAIGGGAITGTNITVERYIPTLTGQNAFWTLIGSPVTGKVPTDFIGLNARISPPANVNVYTYNETDTASVMNGGARYGGDGWKPLASLSLPIVSGVGYRFFANQPLMSGSQTYTISGALKQGNVDVPMTRTPTAPGGYEGGGWNLLGNPYASDIDFNSPSLVKPGTMNNAFWTYDGRLKHYQVYVGASGTSLGSVALNVTGNAAANVIASGQAFWVKLTSGGGATFGFRETAKAASNGTFFRTGAADDVPACLKINLSNAAGYSDEAGLRFNPQSTYGYDAHADAHKLVGSHVNLSLVPQPGTELSLSTQPAPVGPVHIPLKVAVDAAGAYTLRFTGCAALQFGLYLYLFDHVASRLEPVTEGYSYTANLTAADLADPLRRFELIVSPNHVTGLAASQPISLTLYPNPANGAARLSIANAGAAAAIVQIADLAGRTVFTTTYTGDLADRLLPLSGLAPGVYTVRLAVGTAVLREKLVVE